MSASAPRSARSTAGIPCPHASRPVPSRRPGFQFTGLEGLFCLADSLFARLQVLPPRVAVLALRLNLPGADPQRFLSLFSLGSQPFLLGEQAIGLFLELSEVLLLDLDVAAIILHVLADPVHSLFLDRKALF